MLEGDAVAELIKDAIGSVFAGHDVQRISIQPSVDWVGEDSLRITVIAGDDDAHRPGPDKIVDLENLLHDRMIADGDTRLSFVYVYTPADHAEDVEFES